MRLLLVEDDRMIAESVIQSMQRHGHAVDWVTHVRFANLATRTGVYDLLLLDLGLPDGDGTDVLAAVRARGSKTPALILTARDAVEDRIQGLDAGADDYLSKPFDLEELAARVRALLRRSCGKPQPVFHHGSIAIDPASKKVFLNNELIFLGPKEFVLLFALIQAPEKVHRRKDLEEKLYGWDNYVASNTIEVHIHGLRRKLGTGSIVTIRGFGYRLGNVE